MKSVHSSWIHALEDALCCLGHIMIHIVSLIIIFPWASMKMKVMRACHSLWSPQKGLQIGTDTTVATAPQQGPHWAQEWYV